MNYDEFGRAYTDTEELCELLYRNPELDISKFTLTDPGEYNHSVQTLYADMPQLEAYFAREHSNTIVEFDKELQEKWFMPEEYYNLDIAEYILSLCKEEYELQRVGQELLLFQERNLFNLLRYLKYLVDTMRKNNVVWGVGRGSSVASYVLFLIGVHKIDSIYYQLDIEEFLK